MAHATGPRMGINADPRFSGYTTSGVQRDVPGGTQHRIRDFVRISFSGTSSYGVYEPIERQGLRNFNPSAVLACVDTAIVNRTSSAPVLIHLSTYPANSIAMSAQGNGPSIQPDNVLAAITPNVGVRLYPTPGSCGAQFLNTNLLNNRLELAFTDATGAFISDVTSFYVSITLFERD